MAAFLYLNGYEMNSTEAEEVSVVLKVATGKRSQAALADWIQRSISRR
jgi:prophage maintenance system killer protein